jgi:cell wall-associated NlpC family hydrolase
MVALLLFPGCARTLVDLNPLRPVIRGTIGPVTIEGIVEGGDVRLTIDDSHKSTARHSLAWSHAAAGASAARVLSTAERFLGTPYKYGGTTPSGGFDCSGFVQFVFVRHGLELPRTSRDQALAGQAAPHEITALKPGDLMFFDGKGRGIDHVAIYVGEGRIIHASAGSGRVRYDDLNSNRGKWFLEHHVTSRRVLR